MVQTKTTRVTITSRVFTVAVAKNIVLMVII